MNVAFRQIERAEEELAQIRAELSQLEKHIDRLRESVHKSLAELFGSDHETLPRLEEAALAARIAQLVLSRISVGSSNAIAGKRYIREREAADYIGVKVSTLRAWRALRSNNGPPFAHVGRMVLYPVKALEEYMQERMVSGKN
jgi:predicted DNA-binding transcriptional regulator AlpA